MKSMRSNLIVGLAVLPDDPDPGQHVVPVLSLQQVLTEVLCGEPQGVLTFGFTVGDVNQTAADADRGVLVLAGTCPRPVKDRLSLILVEEEQIGTEHGEDAFPRPHATSNFLRRNKRNRSRTFDL